MSFDWCALAAHCRHWAVYGTVNFDYSSPDYPTVSINTHSGEPLCVRVCVCASVRACVGVCARARVCVRACVRAHVYACACICVRVRMCVRLCLRVCVFVCVCVCVCVCVWNIWEERRMLCLLHDVSCVIKVSLFFNIGLFCNGRR